MSCLVEMMCDGGPHTGLGHLRRSATLARAMERQGFRVRVTRLSDAARSVPLELPAHTGPASLRLFDLPDSVPLDLEQRNPDGLPTIALDYFGEEEPDLTVSVRERGQRLHGERRSGYDYAIVRDDVRESQASDGERVLVMLGGADVARRSGDAVEWLRSHGAAITLIVGPYTECDLREAEDLRILRNPPDLCEHMASCHFAICSGGVSLSELMSLGKACIVLAQTEAERALAEDHLECEAIVALGLPSTGLPSHEELVACGRRAARIIDGRGADRIAALAWHMSGGRA